MTETVSGIDLLQPRTLSILLVEPSTQLLDNWVACVQFHLRDAAKSIEKLRKEVLYLGDKFMSLIDRLAGLKGDPAYNLIKIFAVLVFMDCTPPSQKHIGEADKLFMKEFHNDLGMWIIGSNVKTVDDSKRMFTPHWMAEKITRYCLFFKDVPQEYQCFHQEQP